MYFQTFRFQYLQNIEFWQFKFFLCCFFSLFSNFPDSYNLIGSRFCISVAIVSGIRTGTLLTKSAPDHTQITEYQLFLSHKHSANVLHKMHTSLKLLPWEGKKISLPATTARVCRQKETSRSTFVILKSEDEEFDWNWMRHDRASKQQQQWYIIFRFWISN